jgi:hypothetical protein
MRRAAGWTRARLWCTAPGAGPLRNITQQYVPPAAPAAAAGPLRIDMSDPLVTDRLGPGWYDLESGIRWMARTASVRMPGPRAAGQRLM